jgi:hypothetical protein
MTKIRKSSIALAAVVGAGGLFLSDHFSTTVPRTFLSQAEAVIGRPLTPLSVAGVTRRTTRRAVAAGAIGYGAYAVGRYGYSGYNDTPGYTDYGYSGYHGTPDYASSGGQFRDYGYYGEYGNGYVMRPRVPRAGYLDPNGYHGYVPNNWATYCGQLPKAC